MSLDRPAWLQSFAANGKTPWQCPDCGGARLQVMEGTLHKRETRESGEGHNSLAWEPHWVDGRFACMLVCPNCGTPSAVAGTYSVEEGIDTTAEVGEPPIYTWEDFKPRFFSDPPRIIAIPENVPAAIVEDLTASFGLYWVDAESCANRIRSSIERLLTYLRVRRTTISKKGKRLLLSLHTRIELFRASKPALADALMAVKWIGNAGSHTQSLNKQDLLDGYELLHYVLGELFSKRDRRIAQLSRQINRRKKPRSARRLRP